jgi:hypothetical protein
MYAYVPVDIFTGSGFAIREAENGLTEIIIHDTDRKIMVDMNNSPVESLVYYIGDTAHTMVKYDPYRYDISRYYSEPADNGGVTLRYVIKGYLYEGIGFDMYRSTVPGEWGERIQSHADVGFYDRILFTFTDTTAKPGNTYYYTLVSVSERWASEIATGGENHQMRVITELIYNEETPEEPPPPPEPPPEEPPQTETTNFPRTVVIISIITLAFTALLVIIYKRIQK